MQQKTLSGALAVIALLCITGNAAAATIGIKCNVGGLSIYSQGADIYGILGYKSYEGSTVAGQNVNVNLETASLGPKLYKIALQKDGSTKCSFWISITQAGTIDVLTKIQGCTSLQKTDSTHIYAGVDSSVSTQNTWTYSYVGQVQVAKKTGQSDCCRYQTSTGTYGWITNCYKDGNWMRGKKNNLDIIININNQKDVRYLDSGTGTWKTYGTTSTTSTSTTQNTWTYSYVGQVQVAKKTGQSDCCRYQTSTGTYGWITNCYKDGNWMRGKKNNLDIIINTKNQKDVRYWNSCGNTWKSYNG